MRPKQILRTSRLAKLGATALMLAIPASAVALTANQADAQSATQIKLDRHYLAYGHRVTVNGTHLGERGGSARDPPIRRPARPLESARDDARRPDGPLPVRDRYAAHRFPAGYAGEHRRASAVRLRAERERQRDRRAEYEPAGGGWRPVQAPQPAVQRARRSAGARPRQAPARRSAAVASACLAGPAAAGTRSRAPAPGAGAGLIFATRRTARASSRCACGSRAISGTPRRHGTPVV